MITTHSDSRGWRERVPEAVSRRRMLLAMGVGAVGGATGLLPGAAASPAQAECEGAVLLAPEVNTAEVFQGIGGYDPDGSDLPNQATPITSQLSTGGLYTDDGAGSLFHLASYVHNTGSRPTVAVFGFGKGKHVFGGNFVGYTDGPDHSALGVEIDFGNLNSTPGGISHGLLIKSLGGNVGGQGGRNYLQMHASIASSTDDGIVFHRSFDVPAVASTGTLIKAGGEEALHGIGFGGSRFTSAAAFLPVNSGSTTTSTAIILSAEGGFANAGCFIDMRSSAPNSSVNDGLRFRLSGGRQPVTGSLIRALAGVSSAIGLNLADGTFSTAGIAMGPNNISTDTTTGMKLGTHSSQKVGFWGKTPIARPLVTGDTASSPVAVLRNLLSALDSAGLIDNATT